MNKRSILRDLFINLKDPISDTPQDDHIDRITDYSTRYGQAPAVSTQVRLVTGRWATMPMMPDG